MSIDVDKLGGPYACVFDVGAFQGDFAQACLYRWPGCHVESFEPLMPAPTTANGNWRWWRVALGDFEGEVSMYQNEFIPSSSILKMKPLHYETFPYTTQAETTIVHVYPLCEYEEFITDPALLKIDVQGYELEVLRGAAESIRRFETIVLEVSHEELYEGAPTPKEIDDYLHQAGFAHSSRVDQMLHPEDGRILQSDEMYVRR